MRLGQATSPGLATSYRVALLIVLAACSRFDTERAPSPVTAPIPPAHVGASSCRECHPQQWELWRGSHHDLAMQEASASTVLGDFDDASFTHFGVTSTFSRRGDELHVRTDGADGELADFTVAWVFGVEPLQQVLLELGDGRIQALGIAWDSRPADSGGQRWFHLYPDEPIPHDDPLHWTGRDQNWNYMCAECHSTNIRKNYDVDTDSYSTTWSEIDVACESCHGPSSLHLEWARSATRGDDSGVISLKESEEASWIMDLETGIATRSRDRVGRSQIETCARCHSRRSVLSEEFRHGRPLLDTHRLSLLEDPLYFPDGQIREEVYVHGSFLQSRMYRAGVTCSDCHDPHSLSVRGKGNARCAACHLPARFDSPDHHFHPSSSAGAECVGCHMPERTYMVVDPRRDHSFRVPRPDLSAALDSPDACTSCHENRAPAWAAERIAKWYGEDRRRERHYGELLHAARDAAPGADSGLLELAGDAGQPGIVRATALALLRRAPDASTFETLRIALHDPDPLVRLAALGPIEAVEPAARTRLVSHLLDDPIRGVRAEAARLMAGVSIGELPPGMRSQLEAALEEYRAGLRLNADRPEAWLSLGLLEAARGDISGAAAAYRRSIALDRRFVPAYVNLADLKRAQGGDVEGEGLLRRAIEAFPDSAEARHALGLLLVRLQRLDEAIAQLDQAAGLAPGEPRFGYVYGVALESAGRIDEALEALAKVHRRHPSDPPTLVALATLSEKHGRTTEALAWARRLVALDPSDPAARGLLQELEATVPRL